MWRRDVPDVTVARWGMRDVVARFEDPEALEDAIEELELEGFDRARIEVISALERLERYLGRRLAGIRELEDADVPAGVPVDRHERAEGGAALVGAPALAAGMASGGLAVAAGAELAGAYAAALLGGLAGAGLGALLLWQLARRLDERRLRILQAGGPVVRVEVHGPAEETRALEILRRAGGRDVHAVTLERRLRLADVPFARTQPDPLLLG